MNGYAGFFSAYSMLKARNVLGASIDAMFERGREKLKASGIDPEASYKRAMEARASDHVAEHAHQLAVNRLQLIAPSRGWRPKR